ncbi:hypothetical protein K505DRAFT_327830 [Melanomma pulvis-pyrius CBS 109.77]|uniref:Uncharacterized protein n=1 Tax=Melanomma pulvis-pyrius CBS 109.77 TaxID=1314802 RepID=A0A6A6X113_9PLEO|nr:hypothetical protein K505DRAFT_327830 [Melanomma pulvis-pyrius CBS 109.77]
MSISLSLQYKSANGKDEFAIFSPKESSSPPEVKNASQDDELRYEADDTGIVKVMSPIHLFPKPLALSYQNFLKHYSSLQFTDGTRKEAGSRLVASLLGHYFPKPKFNYWKLDHQEDSLIQSVPAYGTLYWAVTVSEEDSQVKDTALRRKVMSKSPLDGSMREDSVFPTEKSPFVLLVAVVTYTNFLSLPERHVPSRLTFSNNLISKTSDAVVIEGIEYRQGSILILGGKPRPLSPTFEFYNFDVDSKDRTSLVPWFGELESAPGGLGTNMFSLATAEAEKVDRMFKGIISISAGNKALNPDSSAILQAARHQVVKRQNLKPQPQPRPQPVSNTPSTMTNEFLRTLKYNKTGKLQGVGGRFLPAEKEMEAKREVAARGITLETSTPRRRKREDLKLAKLAMENRLSMTPDRGL